MKNIPLKKLSDEVLTIQDNSFISVGPNIYILEFLQDDYIGLENCGFILTRLHNIYLQIGVQTEVISLIAFVAFYIMCFVQSILIYIKGKSDIYASYSVQ